MTTVDEDKISTAFDVLDALRDVIIASDPAKRAALTKAIDDWAECFPDDYFWASGMRAPTLLQYLLMEIELAALPDAQPNPPRPPRPVIRLVDRKPQRETGDA